MLRRNDSAAPGPRFGILRSVSFRLLAGLVVIAILSLTAIGTAVITLRLTAASHDQIATTDLPYLSAASQLSQTANLVASAAYILATAGTEYSLRAERNKIDERLNDLDGLLAEIKQHVDTAPPSDTDAHELFARVNERRNRLVANIDQLNASVLEKIDARSRFLAGTALMREAMQEIGEADLTMASNRDDIALVVWTNLLADLTSDAYALPVLASRRAIEQASGRTVAALEAITTEIEQMGPDVREKLDAPWQVVLNQLSGDGNLFETRLEILALEREAASILSENSYLSGLFVGAVSDLFLDVQSDFDQTNRRVLDFVGAISTILLAVGGVTVLLVVLLTVYIRRSVVERLTRLKGAIESHFKGEQADIPTTGNDELAQIGGALAYFVEAISEREQRMIQARKEAEAANEAKSDFLAVVSHELRTPMYGVLAMARFLLESNLDREQRDFAGSIVSSGETLLSLLNDILDFSKIEAGKFELDTVDFDVRYEIDSFDSLISGNAESKGLAFAIGVAPDVPTWLAGDSRRIRQILTNLANNAIKFTKAGEVRVNVKRVKPPDPHAGGDLCWLRFEVTDTGVGIDEDTQKILFRPFTQADASTAREYGGTGLGLSICNRLVALMGGTIGVHSKPGTGSTFYFTVPFKQVPAGRVRELEAAQGDAVEAGAMYYEAPGREEAVQAGCLVLVAEDNPTNRKIIEKLMARLGYVCDIVENGEEAWDAFLTRDYGLVVTDCRMPVLDGFELTIRIRQHERSGRHRTPIIALTADALQQTKERCRMVGMDDALTKPVEFLELDKAITRWLPVAADLRTAKEGGETRSHDVLHEGSRDILDPTPLVEAFGGIDDDALDFLRKFVVSADAKINSVLRQIDELDTRGLSDLVHSLKGECYSFGGMKLGSILGEFELDLKGASSLKEWKPEIVSQWKELTDSVHRFVSEHELSDAPATDRS